MRTKLKKYLAILLAMVCTLQLLPLSVFADDSKPTYRFGIVEVESPVITEKDIENAINGGLSDLVWHQDEYEKIILSVVAWDEFQTKFDLSMFDLLKYRSLIVPGLQYKILYESENWKYDYSLTTLSLYGVDNDSKYAYTIIKLFNPNVKATSTDSGRAVADLLSNHPIIATLLGLNGSEDVVETEEKKVELSTTITCEDNTTYKITLTGNTQLENANLYVNELTYNSMQPTKSKASKSAETRNNEASYEQLIIDSVEALNMDSTSITDIKMFNFELMDEKFNPLTLNEDVFVTIELIDKNGQTLTNTQIVELGNKPSEINSNQLDAQSLQFNTTNLMSYSLISTDLNENKKVEPELIDTYYENDEIILEGRLPKDCVIDVEPITIELENLNTILSYDITIYANQIMRELNMPWQPSEDGIKVTIKSEGFEHITNNVLIYHIENSEQTCIGEYDVVDNTVEFTADHFSIYSVVESPAPVELADITIQNVNELINAENTPILLSIIRGSNRYYFKNTINNKNCIDRTSNSAMLDAALWYVEIVDASTNKVKLYTYENNSTTESYLKVRNDGFIDAYTSNENATVFVVDLFTAGEEGSFSFKVDGKNQWLNYSGGNDSFKTYTTKNTDCKIILSYAIDQTSDLYELDGLTYGIIHIGNNAIYGHAMMADVDTNRGSLKQKQAAIKTNPVDHTSLLCLDDDETIDMWTFHNIGAGKYTVSARKNGINQYIKITNNKLSLTELIDEATAFDFMPGTDVNEGKFQLVFNSRMALTYENSNFVLKNNTKTTSQWFELLRESQISYDDFTIYSAKKVSIADLDKVTNRTNLVLYIRHWNEVKKAYEFYVMDYNGFMIHAYESEDLIQWVSTPVSTSQWKFIEYYYEGTDTPNYYYDLQNTYSGKYLAPQVNSSKILSDNPIGLTLNGRRYGDAYSTILAWDDFYYTYAGLKDSNYQVISDLLAYATDFYVAILDETSHTSTSLDPIEPTIDNDQYNITIKMINFDNTTVRTTGTGGNPYTSVEQAAIFGLDKSNKDSEPDIGILSTNLEEDGYPMVLRTGFSLKDLYSEDRLVTVNHLFPQIKYLNSGYFDYDSAESYAYLDQNTNNFIIYNALGTTDKTAKPSLSHGQFFPYNELIPDHFAVKNPENLYNSILQELSEDNPRKHEKLYLIDDPDYYYGIEMSSSFIQTPNGLDNWGHDIIFEFTGDDDFWFYLDGELVIDLGGIHSALPGSINYHTGTVSVNGTTRTIHDIFKSNYEGRNPDKTPAEVNAYLDDIFVLNDEGNYVFKNFSKHTFKMFYMERGASAANLKMRFNLTSVKENQVLVKKQISGTDKLDYRLSKYAFQIWYTVDGTNYQRFTDTSNVLYSHTDVPVEYAEHYNPPGTALLYDDVFFLKADEIMAINLPEDTTNYKILECAVNEHIYDHVYVNDEEIFASETVEIGRADFMSPADSTNHRPIVVFDNHINANALRTLLVEKELRDVDGSILHYDDDKTTFSMRLSLSMDGEPLTLAYLQNYRIKDEHNNYCIWNPYQQRFESLNVADFEHLSEEQQIRATFQTSTNGSISKIPAGYTIEVPYLLIGTKFMIEERENELPAGYVNVGYERVEGTYIVEDGDDVNEGLIRDNSDPVIKVINQRGYGFTVMKEWSDSDYVQSHDTIYVALYKNDELVPNSVRAYTNSTKFVYWFMGTLEDSINNYHIYEVKLTGDVLIDENGVVSNYDSIEILNEHSIVNVETISLENTSVVYPYDVNYDVGQVGGEAQNLRTDTIINVRAGIRIIKQDMFGNPLKNAIFTLTDSLGNPVGKGTYVSDGDGQITIAYLEPNEIYTLTETKSPNGYQRLVDTIHLSIDGEQHVTIDANEYVILHEGTDETMPEIIVQNRPISFNVKKVDRSTNNPMAGVEFSLYKQVNSYHGPIMDYVPMEGYESLLTDENGMIQQLDQNLPFGTYYLVEKATLDDYYLLTNPICFTIDSNGVFVEESNDCVFDVNQDSLSRSYALTVYNDQVEYINVTIIKHIEGSLSNKTESFKFQFNDKQFTLSHNDQMSFTLERNEYIALMEIIEDPTYDISFRVLNEDDEDVTSQFTVDGNVIYGNANESITVVVTNLKEAMTPTGIKTHSLFMLCGMVLCLSLILILRKKLRKI